MNHLFCDFYFRGKLRNKFIMYSDRWRLISRIGAIALTSFAMWTMYEIAYNDPPRKNKSPAHT